MEPTDIAWAAGLVDGDGSITFNRSSGEWYRPQLSIDSADREIIEAFVRMFGGNVVTKKRTKEHHNQVYTWRLLGHRCLTALGLLLPYMRCDVKKRRARLIVDEWPKVKFSNQFVSDEQKERRRAFQDTFRAIGAGRGSQCRA